MFPAHFPASDRRRFAGASRFRVCGALHGGAPFLRCVVFMGLSAQADDDQDAREEQPCGCCDPDGCEDPPPGPVDDVGELQDDERDGEEADETDPSGCAAVLGGAVHGWPPSR